jgi:hypothetical protein
MTADEKGPKLRLATTAFLLAVLVCPSLWAQSESGWICVSPVPERPPSKVQGLCSSGKLSLKIDTRQTVPWPHKESLKIEALDLTQSHLVAAICDGKPVQSFKFRFSEYKSGELCLTFEDLFDGYEGMRLWEARHATWCKKCK